MSVYTGRKTLLGALVTLAMSSAGCTSDAAATSITRLYDVAAGTECSAGGVAIRTGPDSNENGQLDDDEAARGVSKTLCNMASLSARVNIVDVSKGEECRYGGQRVESGLDDDNDGTLEASEVDGTQLVCNARTLDVIQYGTVNVYTALDFAALAGKEVLVGNLYVRSDALETLELPALEEISGDFEVHSNGIDADDVKLKSIRLPSLRVAHHIELRIPLVTEVSFPKLEQVQYLEFSGAEKLTSVSMPELLRVADQLRFADVDQPLTLSFPKLASVGSVYLYNSRGLTQLLAPNLTEIRSRFYMDATENLTALSLPKLAHLGSLDFYQSDLVTLNLPALETLDAVYITSMGRLETFSLPALRHARSIVLNDNESLQEIDLPLLVLETEFSSYNNQNLSECGLTQLQAQLRSRGAGAAFYGSNNLSGSACTVNSAETCFSVKVAGVDSGYHQCLVRRDYESARTDCQTLFSEDLATFDSVDQFTSISNVFATARNVSRVTWLGLDDASTDGVWAQVGGNTGFQPSVDDTSVWAPEEPNGNLSENCAVIYDVSSSAAGKLNDANCIGAFELLCRAGT